MILKPSYFPPVSGRVHEACGSAALSFAMSLCAGKKAVWITLAHRAEQMNPSTLSRFSIVGDVTFVRAVDSQEQLWCMEETLRSKSVGCVICIYEDDVDFTAARRLQLAAEAGGSLGLMIIGEGKGSPVAETRWRCVSLYDSEQDDSTLQQWEIIKNKRGTIGGMKVKWDDETHSIIVVSTHVDRAGDAPSPDSDPVCDDNPST